MGYGSAVQLIIMELAILRELARRFQIIVSPVEILWERPDWFGAGFPLIAPIKNETTLEASLFMESPFIGESDDSDGNGDDDVPSQPAADSSANEGPRHPDHPPPSHKEAPWKKARPP